MSLPPFRPEDFDEACETCLAPPGQLCRPWCDTGYTAVDHRAQTERHTDQLARRRRTAPASPAPEGDRHGPVHHNRP